MQRDSTKRFHHNNVPAARELRGRETRAEEVLWQELRSRRLDGLKFRRQHPLGPFVLDFCCVERRLAVEVDGGIHDTQQEQDVEREALLVTAGIRVLRFSNEDVQQRLSRVLESIQTAAQEEPPSRPKAPGRRAGWS
jgi:very-short-patch-repair endonuclease